MSPARWTPFPYRPVQVRPVCSWPACVRSVYGHVVSAVVVLLVPVRVSCLLVALFGVCSLALQRALAQSDLLRAGVLLVAVLVGASCAGPAQYVFTVRRLPTVGEKSNDKWPDRCKTLFQILCPFPCPALAVLHAKPIIWYFVVLCGRPSSFACAIHMYTPRRWQGHVGPLWCIPCSPWEPHGAVLAGWCGARACVCLPAVRRIVPCVASHVAGVPVSQC